jgi:hypothetical protein
MTTTYPASQKQFDFIKRLVGEKALDAITEAVVVRYRAKAVEGTLTSREASSLIDALLTLPRKATEEASTTEREAGVYEDTDGRLFRVYLGQQSGKMLVKEIIVDEDGVGYHYLGAAARHLPSTARRLSLAEVGAMGKTFDHCLTCGRRLDDPESVDRGIGPVCAKKYDAPVVEDYSTTPGYTEAVQQAEREDDERAYASKVQFQAGETTTSRFD